MALSASAIRGVFLMVGSALLLNVQLILCRWFVEAGWSDFTIQALSCAMTAACCVVGLVISCPPAPAAEEYKWILLAGVFFAGSFSLMVLALRVGITLGDFAALNSANVVFAAFLGRAFLRELLHWAHFAAVGCSVVGALLISRPEFLFGGAKDDSNDSAWQGHLLALASGLCDACIYICSRRLEGTPPWLINISFCGQSASVLLLCGLLSDSFVLAPFLAAPVEGFSWLVATFVGNITSIMMFTVAAQSCPAAVSATVDTATRMVSGYGAQALLFQAPLEQLTFLGAALMFASVVTMALVQAPERLEAERLHSEASPKLEQDAPSPEAGAADAEGEDDNESLASFIASEFACASSYEGSPRLRRRSVVAEPAARVIGAVAAVTSVAASA